MSIGNKNNNFYIGVDIGGTNLVCGLVTSEGRVVQKYKQSTEADKGSTYVIDRIATMINEIIVQSGVSREQIHSVGVGTPGLVDPVQGISIQASNLGWRHLKLADELEQRLRLPVFMDNDVRMYVFGEAMYGSGKLYDHVLGITLGTGLASALVNKGQLYYGGGFLAGELGHICYPRIYYDFSICTHG